MNDGIGRALARGVLASVAGILAMDLYSRAMKKVEQKSSSSEKTRERKQKTAKKKANGALRRLEDISLVGRTNKKDEPATVAVGRIAYERLRGRRPTRQKGAQLGKAVHWGYGLAMGGLWGLLERRIAEGDLKAGLGYGAALWLLGDELAVPLLGLAKGPTAHPPRVHAQALGAHLVYGLTTGAATKILQRVM